MIKKYQKMKKIINQSELARKIGVSPEYVRMLLSGRRKNAKRLEEIDAILVKELEGFFYTISKNKKTMKKKKR